MCQMPSPFSTVRILQLSVHNQPVLTAAWQRNSLLERHEHNYPVLLATITPFRPRASQSWKAHWIVLENCTTNVAMSV